MYVPSGVGPSPFGGGLRRFFALSSFARIARCESASRPRKKWLKYKLVMAHKTPSASHRDWSRGNGQPGQAGKVSENKSPEAVIVAVSVPFGEKVPSTTAKDSGLRICAATTTSTTAARMNMRHSCT